MLCIDREKVKNWTAIEAKPVEVLITYKADDEDISVKLFLCKASVGNYLISEINDSTIWDPAQKQVSILTFLTFIRLPTNHRCATSCNGSVRTCITQSS